MKKMKIEIPEVELLNQKMLNPERFNPHNLTVEEIHYINELIHVAKTSEQINLITLLYDKIKSVTSDDERTAYMDRFFRELEKVKGHSDNHLRTSVVSKLTATELKQLFKIRLVTTENA